VQSQDVILGMLMKASLSGYEIKQHFETLFSHFYNASFGTIYPTLNRMERDGLLTKRSLAQVGKPNKNIYTITAKGRQAFYRYLESDIQETEVKSDFMLRLFFGEWADRDRTIQWLEDGIRRHERTLAKLYADREQWAAKLSPTQRVCLNIGIANTEGALQQLREGLAELQSGAGRRS